MVLVDAEVIESDAELDQIGIASEWPCLNCETTACLSHCPAEALTLGSDPNLDACVSHRLADDSSCASTCLARLACPVGSGFRYSDRQTAYFYNRSLVSVMRWVNKEN